MPLLLLHGAIGTAAQFRDLSTVLALDFEVYSLNFSGHGGTALPDEAFSIPLFAEDVLRFMQEKELEQVDIFGFSMGGYVALYLAKHHPEKVGKIFTLGTKFDWSPEIAAAETRMLNPQKIAEKVPKFASLLAERHAPTDWTQVLEKTAAMMVKLGDSPALSHADLTQINHAVRVGVGDRDNMVGLTETMVMYHQLPNGSFSVFPETQHPFEMLEQERLVFEIKEFFK